MSGGRRAGDCAPSHATCPPTRSVTFSNGMRSGQSHSSGNDSTSCRTATTGFSKTGPATGRGRVEHCGPAARGEIRQMNERSAATIRFTYILDFQSETATRTKKTAIPIHATLDGIRTLDSAGILRIMATGMPKKIIGRQTQIPQSVPNPSRCSGNTTAISGPATKLPTMQLQRTIAAFFLRVPVGTGSSGMVTQSRQVSMDD